MPRALRSAAMALLDVWRASTRRSNVLAQGLSLFGPGIVERVIDALRVGESLLARSEVHGARLHEGIGEDVANTAFPQPLDGGVGEARSAYIVAIVHHGGGAIGQHLEATDTRGVVIVLGQESLAQRQQVGEILARP